MLRNRISEIPNQDKTSSNWKRVLAVYTLYKMVHPIKLFRLCIWTSVVQRLSNQSGLKWYMIYRISKWNWTVQKHKSKWSSETDPSWFGVFPIWLKLGHFSKMSNLFSYIIGVNKLKTSLWSFYPISCSFWKTHFIVQTLYVERFTIWLKDSLPSDII